MSSTEVSPKTIAQLWAEKKTKTIKVAIAGWPERYSWEIAGETKNGKAWLLRTNLGATDEVAKADCAAAEWYLKP